MPGMTRCGQTRLNRVKLETILNQLIPAHRRGFEYAAWGVVLLVLVHLCWLQLRPESELRRFWAVVTESPASRAAATEHGQSDRIVWRATDGNLLLKLAGYAKTNPAVANSLGYFYFQTSYALYPRRLYAAPDNQIINDGRDIMRIGFSPGPQWLQAHDVRSVLIFGKDNASEETPRLEILQPRDGRDQNAGQQSRRQLMAFLACCLYLLLILLVGFTLLSVIQPSSRLTIVQLIGLAPAIGAGIMGLLLFWTSLIGFAPSRTLLVIISVLTLASLVVMKKNNRLARIKILATDWEKGDLWIVAPLALTLAGLAMIVVVTLLSPLTEWDAFAIWGFKAKVLAHEALRPTPACFHDLTLSYSHLDYPLLVPFLTAGAYAAMGTVDDQTGKLVSVFLDVLLVPMVYLGLRWKLRRLPAACLSAILAMLPVMFRYGGVGCADLPLAMFYTGSIFYVARWIDRQQWPDLILAILFSAFAAFTKNEGAVLALMNGAVILGFGIWAGRRHVWAGAAVFFAGLLAMDAAWLSWSWNLPRTHEDYGSKLLSSALVTHLPKLKEIIPAMLVQMAEFQVWGLLWIMAVVLVLLGWRALTRPYVLVLWALLGMQLMIYALAYSVTPWDLAVLMPMTMDRLLLHTVPAVIFLAGWHWAEMGTGLSEKSLVFQK